MKEDPTSEAAEPTGPPIRVLIVDNDEALARAMEEALANWLRVQIARIEHERGITRKEGAA